MAEKPRFVAGKNVFLGGTVAGYKWRDELKELLNCAFHDPVLPEGEDYDNEARKKELQFRKFDCTHVVYVLTPDMNGFYSIVEAVEDAILRPRLTYICFYEPEGTSFNEDQKSSIEHSTELLRFYTRHIFTDLKKMAYHINEDRPEGEM